MSVPVDMTSPMRLRRTTAVQWPYIVRSASGRPAATTVTSGCRSATRASSRPLGVGDTFGVVDGNEDAARRHRRRWRRSTPRRRRRPRSGIDDLDPGDHRRVRPRAVQHDDAVAVRVAPAGDEADQRRAATTACRTGDEDVFAVGHLEPDRRQRGEVDADRQRRRSVAVGGRRQRTGVDVVAERADRHRWIDGRRGWRAGRQRQHGELRLEAASGEQDATRDRRRHRRRRGRRGRRTRSGRRRGTASAASAPPTPRGPRRRAARAWRRVWIPAATPSVRTRSNRA